MPTKEILNELFEYRDGMLFWKIASGRRIRVGTIAGCLKASRGYRQVGINGTLYCEHRIIWVLHNGSIPSGFFIDHKDGNPRNNKIENFRLATHNQNAHNQGKHRDNTSGFKGVSWHRGSGSWQARVAAFGKSKSTYYRTPELAHEAYKKAAIELHGEFANFG